jgi:ferredoxin-NADP reductase
MAIALSTLGLLCLAFIACLIGDGLRTILARRTREAEQRPLMLTVAARHDIAEQLLTLQLVPAGGKALPAFRAGQHVLLKAPAGRNGKTIQRAYSLAAWQARPGTYELGIKREAHGAMSQWLWSTLKPGDRIELSRPQGNFVIEPGEGPLVLVGGGIGITPMRAMLHEAIGSGRSIVLFHAARQAEVLLYREEFEALTTRYGNFRYRPILSRPGHDWSGATGRLDAARLCADLDDPKQADFYLCAGNDMMASLRHGLMEDGIDSGRIHWEAFGIGSADGIAGIDLVVSQGDRQTVLRSAGEPSLLATLEANGVDLPSECRAGSCGQCQVRLEDGDVTWLIAPEFSPAPDCVLPCVCAPRSPLSIVVAQRSA